MRALGTVFTTTSVVAVLATMFIFSNLRQRGILEQLSMINWAWLAMPILLAIGLTLWNRHRIEDSDKLKWRTIQSLSTTGVALATLTAILIVGQYAASHAPVPGNDSSVIAADGAMIKIVVPLALGAVALFFFHRKSTRATGKE